MTTRGAEPYRQLTVPLRISSGVTSVGYGDHPTDVPFLAACDSGVLVEEMDEYPSSVTYKAPSKFDSSSLL